MTKPKQVNNIQAQRNVLPNMGTKLYETGMVFNDDQPSLKDLEMHLQTLNHNDVYMQL